MALYIHQLRNWPHFTWDNEVITPLISHLRHRQGRLEGYLEVFGFRLQSQTSLETLTLDVIKSSEIEGEILDQEQVRSSIAQRLGIDAVGLVPADRNVEGVVEMMLDATQNYATPLDEARLFQWHDSLFPTGKSGSHTIKVASWRDGPVQVVSGAMGRERVHYEAPAAHLLANEMELFLNWFNTSTPVDGIIKAAIAHLWFVTIHPFDDGNGRIARAIADMQLARADHSNQRFYSMSAQIRLERNQYYLLLEKIQKGDLDITSWLAWFLHCLDRALDATDEVLKRVLNKTKFWDLHAHTSINERQRLLINKLFDGFVGKLTSSKWAKIAKCSSDTALRDINDLIKKNILQKELDGGRNTSYTLVQ